MAASPRRASENSDQAPVVSPLRPIFRLRAWPGLRTEARTAPLRERRHPGSSLADCGLELHPTKTRIVYCKDDDRPGKHEHIAFDFLGYTFQPRRAKNRWGRYFVSFLPAISTKAATAIRQTIRNWRMASTRNNQRLEDLARLVNPVVRGWLNYYGRFYRSRCVQVLRHFNEALGKWAQRKYTRFRRRERAAMHWLGRIARRDPDLFVLWRQGVRPEAGV